MRATHSLQSRVHLDSSAGRSATVSPQPSLVWCRRWLTLSVYSGSLVLAGRASSLLDAPRDDRDGLLLRALVATVADVARGLSLDEVHLTTRGPSLWPHMRFARL